MYLEPDYFYIHSELAKRGVTLTLDSVVATACANGMKVEEYLTELFRSQPGTLVMPW